MDSIKIVQRTVDFIELKISDELSLKMISKSVLYSPWYVSRVFKRITDISMQEYIKRRRISLAAIQLRDTNKRIIDIAFEYGYSSQEAFTRAFYSLFRISPNCYRNKKLPIPLFCKIDLTHFAFQKGETVMENHEKNVEIKFIKKPERKFYYVKRNGVTNYHEFCKQKDAEEIWGKLLSMPDTLNGIVCGWINESKEDSYAWGVEYCIDYPKSYEWLDCINLKECEYVVFIHSPYGETEHDAVIQSVWDASEKWNPKLRNYTWATDISPIYENETDEGYMIIKPIRKS